MGVARVGEIVLQVDRVPVGDAGVRLETHGVEEEVRAVDGVERLVVAAADVVPRHRDVGGVAVARQNSFPQLVGIDLSHGRTDAIDVTRGTDLA